MESMRFSHELVSKHVETPTGERYFSARLYRHQIEYRTTSIRFHLHLADFWFCGSRSNHDSADRAEIVLFRQTVLR